MEETQKKENLHKGHRERVKEKFLKTGFQGFPTHEILEMLLFYGIPQRDTNEIAHVLLNDFGSLSGVLNADYNDLLKVKGMTRNAAVFLKMLPELFQRYVNDNDNVRYLNSHRDISDYFVQMYFGVRNEVLKLCMLDNSMAVKNCIDIAEGEIDAVDIDLRKIVEATFRANSNYVILAHNHPNGTAEPSQRDIEVTRAIYNTLTPLNILLMDHVVIGNNKMVSMRSSGYFNLL